MSKRPKNKQQQTRQNLAVLATRRFYWFSYNHRFYRRTDNLKKTSILQRIDNLKNIDFTGKPTTLKNIDFTSESTTLKKSFYRLNFNLQDLPALLQPQVLRANLKPYGASKITIEKHIETPKNWTTHITQLPQKDRKSVHPLHAPASGWTAATTRERHTLTSCCHKLIGPPAIYRWVPYKPIYVVCVFKKVPRNKTPKFDALPLKEK